MITKSITHGLASAANNCRIAISIEAAVLVVTLGCSPREPAARQPGEHEAPPTCTLDEDPRLAEAFESIEGMLIQQREADAIPGIAAGVVCGDQPAWANGYGILAVDDSLPITPTTRFRIASLTKLFTATAILELHETGAVELDDPVVQHVPEFRVGRPPATGDAPVTIRQLVTHTSGMPPNSPLTDFPRLFQPAREEALAALPSQQLQSRPGEQYQYSNLGYALLGEVIAQVIGTSYAEYLENEILVPLGMTETLVHPTREDRVTGGHGRPSATGSRPKAGFWELGFFTPAGGMASSVRDLSEFMILHLAPYVGTEPRLLSAETLRNMHQVQHVADPARGGVGFGWAVETSQSQHVVYHGGDLPEQTSYLLIDTRAHIGIVLLSNAQDVDTEAIAWRMLNMVRSAIGHPAPPLP